VKRRASPSRWPALLVAATTLHCTTELQVLDPAEDGEGVVACGGGPGCGVADACRVEGDACASAADCCSGSCTSDDQGTPRCHALDACSTSSGATCTLQAGEICSTDEACCSGACASAGTDKRCAYLGGCHLECELCSSDAECCSHHCADDGTGARRCRAAPGLACRPDGEQCIDGADCCPGSSCGKSEPPLEPRRCHRPSLALPDGATCALPSDCQGDVCAPNDEGTLVCASTCRAEGQPCSARADCCQMLTHECLPVGGAPTCVDLFD
jgi:hypothetical protein